MIEIKTTDDLIDLVKKLKFLGVTQFKIGEIAMDLSGDSLVAATPESDEEADDDEVLYYSA